MATVSADMSKKDKTIKSLKKKLKSLKAELAKLKPAAKRSKPKAAAKKNAEKKAPPTVPADKPPTIAKEPAPARFATAR